MAPDHAQNPRETLPPETTHPVEASASKGADPSRGSPAGWLAVTVALAVVSGFLGAIVYQRTIGKQSEVAEPQTKTASVSGQAVASQASAATEKERKVEIEHQRTQIDALSKQMSQVQEQLESLTKLNAAPSLTTLQIKVAELSNTVKDIAPLPERVDHLDARLDHIRIALDGLRNDIEAIQGKVGRSRTASLTASPGTEATLPQRHEAAKPLVEDKEGEKSFAKGVSLFQKGEFKEAFDVFSKLELARPDDARVWYYAALSRGFATSQWNGATQELVEKGVEREKAGTPKTGEIDNLFQNLTNDTGKNWLSAYRQRAKSN